MNIDKVISGLATSGLLGGLAGGAVGGAVMGNKKARKAAGTALKIGGIAALGGLALKAYRDYQASQSTSPVDKPQRAQHTVWRDLEEERFALDRDSDTVKPALLLVQAMAAAAYADGHLDTAERQRILERARFLDLQAEDKAIVFEILGEPLKMSEVCERVDCPELAAEVYLSSLLAIDADSSEGGAMYLEGLAHRLGLPQPLVEQIHLTVARERADEETAAA